MVLKYIYIENFTKRIVQFSYLNCLQKQHWTNQSSCLSSVSGKRELRTADLKNKHRIVVCD